LLLLGRFLSRERYGLFRTHLRKLSYAGVTLTINASRLAQVFVTVRGYIVVQVHRVKMQDGFVGRTDGVDIWVDERLGAIQLLCTLTHELIHLEWGHSEHQPEHVEMAVRYETARRLLPLDRIVGVCKEDKPLETIARELSVTKRVLMDRAATLSDNEMLSAGCLACRKCPAINARLATRTLVAVA